MTWLTVNTLVELCTISYLSYLSTPQECWRHCCLLQTLGELACTDILYLRKSTDTSFKKYYSKSRSTLFNWKWKSKGIEVLAFLFSDLCKLHWSLTQVFPSLLYALLHALFSVGHQRWCRLSLSCICDSQSYCCLCLIEDLKFKKV